MVKITIQEIPGAATDWHSILTFTVPKPTNILWHMTDSEGFDQTETDVGHIHPPDNIPKDNSKPFIYTINTTVSSDNDANISLATILRYPALSTVIFSQTGLTVHQSIYFRGFGPKGPPTYLEKLDSMDQFTKSQYTPRRRR